MQSSKPDLLGELSQKLRDMAMVQTERSQRIARYRDCMIGSKSLWRADLPQGEQIQAAGVTCLRLWASFLDPDIRRAITFGEYGGSGVPTWSMLQIRETAGHRQRLAGRRGVTRFEFRE